MYYFVSYTLQYYFNGYKTYEKNKYNGTLLIVPLNFVYFTTNNEVYFFKLQEKNQSPFKKILYWQNYLKLIFTLLWITFLNISPPFILTYYFFTSALTE